MRRLPALLAGLTSAVLAATLLSTSAPSLAAPPALRVSTVVGGLDQPWDVKALPDGSLLVTERESRRLLRVSPSGTATPVRYASDTVWAAGETGLMSLAVDPAFTSTRRFYTCHGGYAGGTTGKRDVRVVSWRLSADGTSAAQTRVLLGGIPASSGRHGGCRLLLARDGSLYVGTGDAALGGNPRRLTSLGGKVLRIDRVTGAPVKGNPFYGDRNAVKRRIWTYGHRNVQGLTQRGANVWSAEHGPDRDDEVNRLVRGGDYGWNPVPGYNESVPMTDNRLRGTQVGASWRSGVPTIATSGMTFVNGGASWGELRGTLAVAALKGQRVVFMTFDSRNRLRRTVAPAELRQYGRLRSVTQAANGDLLVTTANGDGRDRVLRVRPA